MTSGRSCGDRAAPSAAGGLGRLGPAGSFVAVTMRDVAISPIIGTTRVTRLRRKQSFRQLQDRACRIGRRESGIRDLRSKQRFAPGLRRETALLEGERPAMIDWSGVAS